jgi:penicillin amidase
MDLQSRAGMGRLAEILGPGLVRFDQERRRMGMPASALASLKLMLRDSISRVALEAYSDGANAWISSLKPPSYPLEFKLIDYAPEAWTPLKSVVLIKNMQWTLSQGFDDTRLANVLDSLGPAFFSRHYPIRHPGAEPVFPGEVFPLHENGGDDSAQGPHAFGPARSGLTSGMSLRTTSSPASPPALTMRPSYGAGQNQPGGLRALTDDFMSRPQPGSGSNNFVLSGERTRTGSPLLANDPHLDLTLPSLWYEVQIKSGNLNAYGVSLPGLPGLVIGFTRGTAWGLTNGMDDVFDWHEPRFRNDSLNQYLWRGRWRNVRRVVDTIAVRGRKPVVDTQLWTHTGPVPVRKGEAPFGPNTPVLHALQWTALEPSNELGAFLRLLTAEDVPDFRRAIRGLQTPVQNIAFAARDDIALVHQGRVPVKRAGQGRVPARGTQASSYATEWRSYIPPAQMPAAVNPVRGWLASANQEVADADYPYYLGSNFYPPERSQRLHRLLVNERAATVSSAWDMLRDDYSRLASRALPLLLRHLPRPMDPLARDSAEFHGTTADSARAAAAERLRAWDYRYSAAASAPVLFDLWWREFYRMVWEDDLRGDSVSYLRPSRAVTVALLATDTLAEAFDDVRTQTVESAGDLARAAFVRACARFDQAGERIDGEVAWGRFRPVSIPHLLRLAPLGASGIETDGCGECVNAQRESHGPSWRMVVQTGKRPEAWGIYPGGQSGNPGSPRYDAFVKDWAEGRAYRLLFLKWPLEVPDSTAYLLALKGKR